MVSGSRSAADIELAEPQTAAPFADIVCAVNGSRGAAEAARQAIALAMPDAALSFIAVSYSTGAGSTETAELGEPRARKALEESARWADRAGVSASTELRKGPSTNEILLAEGERHELMVLGSHGGSRAGGILLGSTATKAAHETPNALLVARKSRTRWRDFPARILLASDGSPGSWAAARATARIARARGSGVEILYVPSEVAPERRRTVSEQVAAIQQLTGMEPTVADGNGHVAERIVEVARGEGSSLIAMGRRGLRGIKALGSVSERVVHRAPCSVLVVPPGEDEVERSDEA
jgi:nucleotide-binding universal stress UspA family protein